nr:glycoside hydrolase [Cohnella zeiphila]
MNRKWKIYVIHHSHSDIGYTERQEKIEQYHADYVRQAIRIVEDARTGSRPEWQGFKWTCETFWAVERFLEKASPDELERFASALRQGDIELSGTYLNMTELIDYDIVGKKAKAAGEYARSIGLSVNSAMTADINGYSWGYSQALYDAGIENLLSCVHTHHGMFAIGRKQTPFYWETPKGDRLLVWNGEHYMLGNDLGLSPGAVLSYTIRDELDTYGTATDHWKLAETRIRRYLAQLESEEYPYSFALVNVMGLLRDNAAPNGDVMAFIRQWNEKHGEQVEIEMTTLSRFFEHVRKQTAPIPTYRGDWPDWWTDGVVSTAVHTQVFRDAQRTLRQVKRLANGRVSLDEKRVAQAEHQLMMYAEHTWGYHSSVYEPWHPMVHALAVRKEAYAAEASRSVYTMLDEVLHERGEALLAAGLPFRYKVINPYDHVFRGVACLYLESWEPSMFPNGFEVYEEADGEPVIPHQMEVVSRGNQISIVIRLAPQEERVFRIRPNGSKPAATTSSTRLRGNDRVSDLMDLYESKPQNGIVLSENHIESAHVCIRWTSSDGIVSWIDKATGENLVRSGSIHGAFTPVYEVTQAPSEAMMADVRRRMGRNRKGPDVRRYAGRLAGVQSVVQGELYGVVELRYELEGTSHYSLYLKVYQDIARVDVSVRMHKDSVWDPENMYLSLPFRSGEAEDQLWLHKTGANVRPGVDQLPGTCTDYYCVQEGMAFLSDRRGLLVAAPDTPLIQTGPLEHGRRLLQGQQDGETGHPLYAWLLSNYWETNFKATLGGFYEFHYRLQWGPEWDRPEKAFRQCEALNAEIPSFRTSS